MTDEVVRNISDRYIELYENVTGKPFEKIEMNENEWISALNDAVNRIILS
jgi:hypothetical protein